MIKPLYTFSGTVENGAGRGRELGFPTANVKIDRAIPEGIYASEVIFDKKTYVAATFIGAAITFGETEYKSETYIFNYDNNLYGKSVKIILYKKIRENKFFSSEQLLTEQIEKDITIINKFFNKE